MSQWIIRREMLKQQISKQINSELKDISGRANKVIKSQLTTCQSINDYPDIFSYLNNLFPTVDLSDVPIYLSSPRVMSKYGFGQCAGCYIPHMDVILVKNKIKMGGDKQARDKLDRLIQEAVAVEVKPEDVIVHELIHAVSFKVGRSGNRKFAFGEEEFVYTNCVDFYRNAQLSDEDIVCGTFLPFCVNDVIKDKNEMCKIWNSVGVVISEIDNETKFKVVTNQHASSLAQKIVQSAKDRARTMIDLYEKYGRQTIHTNVAPNDCVSLRTIDMDFGDF